MISGGAADRLPERRYNDDLYGAGRERKSIPAKDRPALSGGKPKQKEKAGTKDLFRFDFRGLIKPQRFDFSIFIIVVVLLVLGLAMLFSATYASANYRWGDHYHYINRQLIFAGLGFAAMLIISRIDYHLLMNRVVLNFAIMVSVGLMLVVKFFGHTAGGAERWFEIGGITVQPSEILKFVTIMVIADYIQRRYDKMRLFWEGLFPVLVRVGIACGLVVMQPHLSATIIILVISFGLLFIGGARPYHLFLVLAGLALAGFVLIAYVFPAKGLGYVQDRWQSFVDPESDIKDTTYQTYQSLVTIGSGGVLGTGFGNSRQKYSYLPITENDFIFSVIVEELGFVGGAVIIFLFIVLVIRGYYIAASAPDKFGMLLCAGIVTQIGLQAMLNIAVATNAIPNTGVSLPFLSYGGTALIMQLAEMGVVLNISRKAAIE